MTSPKLRPLDQRSIQLLEEIFSTISSSRDGVDAIVYRAQHEEALELLDDLERKGYLRKDYSQKYWLTLCGLSVLGDTSKDLLDRCEKLFSILRARYKSKPQEKITVGNLAATVKFTREQVSECLGYMVEASCWGGHSSDLNSADAFLQASEWILRYKTFREVVDEKKSQRDERELQDARNPHIQFNDKLSRTNRILRFIPKPFREKKLISVLVIIIGLILYYLPPVVNFIDSWKKIEKYFVDDPRTELAQLGVQYSADQFIRSAREGDTRAVKLFLQTGIDPEVRGASHQTALIEAAGYGHLETAKALLAKHVNVNAQDSGGDTALSRAADKGDTQVVQVLIAHGADVNMQNNSGRTALMWASFNGHVETMKTLMDHGAGVNAREREEQKTALVLAAGNHQTPAVQLLLDRGADPNIQDSYGYTALDIAARGGHREMVDNLLKHHADVNLKTKDGHTALMDAVTSKNLEIAEMIKAAGAKD